MFKNIILMLALILACAGSVFAVDIATFLEPPDNAVLNDSTQTLTVEVLGRNGNANFTYLNITLDDGASNLTLFTLNTSQNLTDANFTVASGWNVLNHANGSYTLWSLAYNSSGLVLDANWTGNISVGIDYAGPNVSSLSPLVGIEENTIVTLTADSAAQCRWSLNDQGYANMSNALTGNGTTTTVSNFMSGNHDKTLFFACIDEYQNQGTTSAGQRFYEKAGSIAAQSLLGQQGTVTSQGFNLVAVENVVQSIIQGLKNAVSEVIALFTR